MRGVTGHLLVLAFPTALLTPYPPIHDSFSFVRRIGRNERPRYLRQAGHDPHPARRQANPVEREILSLSQQGPIRAGRKPRVDPGNRAARFRSLHPLPVNPRGPDLLRIPSLARQDRQIRPGRLDSSPERMEGGSDPPARRRLGRSSRPHLPSGPAGIHRRKGRTGAIRPSLDRTRFGSSASRRLHRSPIPSDHGRFQGSRLGDTGPKAFFPAARLRESQSVLIQTE
jgi:hypothetical protein